MLEIASSTSGFRLGSTVGVAAIRMLIASRPPSALMVAIASFFTSRGRSEESSETARASSIRVRTSLSVSLDMAASSNSRFSALGAFRTASAAESRTERSGLSNVRPPIAARMTRRRLLLTLILVTAAFGASPALSPVSGSMSVKLEPDGLVMNTRLSALRT
ncbi:hypothetical protein D3C87_1571800 [compost metagenome]